LLRKEFLLNINNIIIRTCFEILIYLLTINHLMNRLFALLGISGIITMMITTACVTPADIDFPKAEQQLVVYSHFGPGEVLGVYITHTRDPLKPDAPFETLEDVRIKIYENGTLEFDGIDRAKGNDNIPYYETDIVVTDGSHYSMEIVVEDYPKVSATETAPHDRANISHLDLMHSSEEGQTYKLVFSHDNKYDNYYRLIAKRNKWETGVLIDTEIVDYELNNSDDFSLYDIKNHKEWMAVYPKHTGFLFAATKEASDEKELMIHIPNPETNNTNSDIIYNYEVELHNVSADYYRYHESVQAQLSNQNHLADPSLIYNNLEGGFGNFSAYNIATAQTQRMSSGGN